ncbi:hypothetical protein EBZ80_05810 [bacterium]|nr:hypothetical protein [bacterium]
MPIFACNAAAACWHGIIQPRMMLRASSPDTNSDSYFVIMESRFTQAMRCNWKNSSNFSRLSHSRASTAAAQRAQNKATTFWIAALASSILWLLVCGIGSSLQFRGHGLLL